jgi:hypothetical protein
MHIVNQPPALISIKGKELANLQNRYTFAETRFAGTRFAETPFCFLLKHH